MKIVKRLIIIAGFTAIASQVLSVHMPVISEGQPCTTTQQKEGHWRHDANGNWVCVAPHEVIE
jgi:hypothetical protein